MTNGQGYLQNGKEYVYKAGIRSGAGTFDVATHTSGENYKFKVRIQEWKYSECSCKLSYYPVDKLIPIDS